MFRICFPADAPDSIPTPWFELPLAWGGELGGYTPGSPASDIARYEEFLRRELPRRVRGELEVRIEHELSPVEESLKHQLVDIVRDMQQRLFADFRRLQGEVPPVPPQNEEATGNEKPVGEDGGDVKGKERATALESPEDLVMETSTSGASSDGPAHETPAITAGWATAQPIDMYRQPQPLLDGVPRFDGVIFDLGQDWSWADSGYMSTAMSAASSKIIADDDGMLCDDGTIGGHFGGIYGEYRDNWS
jgi:hypothetical protein